MSARGSVLRERARVGYRWDSVAEGYEQLLVRLRDGYSNRGLFVGRRRRR
jgi:hypothetical protein